MKWHSLLKDPNDLPQRINKYEESEDVMVIERRLHDVYGEKVKFDYIVLGNPCYYGHWEPNGEEGWRVRGKNYSDCGKFGGFDTDTSFYDYQTQHLLLKDEMDDLTPESIELIKKIAIDDGDSYITAQIVGWAYYPNEEDFIEENKEFINY